MSSVIGDSRALEHRLNSCGTWDLPRSGIELTCPELEGGFFTTEPPGEPPEYVLVSGNVQEFPGGPVVRTGHFHC